MWKLVVGLGLGLLLAEGMFWLRDGGAFPHLNIYRSDPVLGVALLPGAATRIAFGGNPATDVRTNRDGFRGADWPAPQPDETLVLGDSQVFGLGVAEGDTFSAQLARLLHTPVRNAGVPTYGPGEYTALLERLLVERKPRRVIYVLNVANDLFELDRPNRERHVAWDHWAVRAETAPEAPWAFPGRSWLMSRSHLVFAVRSLLHARAGDDAAFASEGSWRDIAQTTRTSASAAPSPSTAQLKTSLDARQRLSDQWSAQNQRVINEFTSLVLAGGDYAQEAKRLSGYAGDARDIVGNPYAESGRPIAYVAYQLMRAALALDENTELLLTLAKEHGNAALTSALSDRRAARTALAAQGSGLSGASEQPALDSVLELTAAACSKAQASLFVVALPLDVQVSAAEWAKYGLEQRDLGPSEALLGLLTRAAERVSAHAVNALPALRAAEPGAFLQGDLHLSAQGHRALAALLATAVRTEQPRQTTLRLPSGRSVPPTLAEWAASATSAAFETSRPDCTARALREWLRVECVVRTDLPEFQPAEALTLHAGGHGDAMLYAQAGGMRLTLPVLVNDKVAASFAWADAHHALTAQRSAEGALSVVLGPPVAQQAAGDAGPPLPGSASPAILQPKELEVVEYDTIFDKPCIELVDQRRAALRAAGQDDSYLTEPCDIDRPLRTPPCTAGQLAFGTTRRCVSRCASDGSCPAAHHCETFAGQTGCVAP